MIYGPGHEGCTKNTIISGSNVWHDFTWKLDPTKSPTAFKCLWTQWTTDVGSMRPFGPVADIGPEVCMKELKIRRGTGSIFDPPDGVEEPVLGLTRSLAKTW